MNAKELFAAGNLSGAIDALTADVKSHPADAARRTFLFELLSFAGQYERAAKQLEVIAHQDIQSDWATQVYLNIVHAEGLRARVFAGQARPEFMLDVPEYAEWHLKAIACLGEGRPAEAQRLLDESAAARPGVRGTAGEQGIDDFSDCDDLVAPFLELILIRDYIWLPIEQVSELEISKPERPRDLLWTPVRVTLRDGLQRRGYMPSRYAGTEGAADDALKLGRATDWQAADDGPVRGVGQREFLVGDEARAMLSLPLVRLEVA